MILLDTDICIELLRGNKTVIAQRQKCDEQVSISFMTVGELYYGAERSTNKLKNIHIIDEFMLSIYMIDTDIEILKKFGRLKASLYKDRILIPDADILIAATAMTKCTKLITGNIKHFNRFDNLTLENWLV
jgi:predicted nucleic acid-binding protein